MTCSTLPPQFCARIDLIYRHKRSAEWSSDSTSQKVSYAGDAVRPEGRAFSILRSSRHPARDRSRFYDPGDVAPNAEEPPDGADNA